MAGRGQEAVIPFAMQEAEITNRSIRQIDPWLNGEGKEKTSRTRKADALNSGTKKGGQNPLSHSMRNAYTRRACQPESGSFPKQSMPA